MAASRFLTSTPAPPLPTHVVVCARALLGVALQRVEDLKKIGADAGVYFPTEFSSVKPHRVQRKYLQVQEQQAREEAGEML